MKRIAVYGAGNNLQSLVEANCLETDDKLVLIIDQNRDKWGKEVHGCKVMGLDAAFKNSIDKLIVSIAEYDGAIPDIREYIEDSKIFIYDARNKAIIPFDQVKKAWMNRALLKNRIVEHIQIDLLDEAARLGEFNGIETVIVAGSDYVPLLRDYFSLLDKHIDVKEWDDLKTKNELVENKSVVFILCDKDYIKRLSEIKEREPNDHRWIILPLYDVEPKVKVRKDIFQ